MYRLTFVLAVWVISSLPLWGQHSGRQTENTENSMPPAKRPPASAGEQFLTVKDAIKATQEIYRELEKGARQSDEKKFRDTASRYEASIDALVRSIDTASPADADRRKNLEMAIRALDRQSQQLERLAKTVPGDVADSLSRLGDVVALAHDEAMAQQAVFRQTQPGGHDRREPGAHQSGGGHGCGGSLKILRRIL